jgi:MFS family permease
LLAAQAVTQVGDVLYDLGVVWLTLQATGSVFAAGAVAATSFLPSLIVGAALFSALQIAYGLGVALGCYLVGRYLVGGGGPGALMAGAYLARAGIYILLPRLGDAPALPGLLLVLGTGLALPAVTVSVPTMLQQVSRQTRLGRVFGVYTLLSAGLVSLSILLYGWLATRLSLDGFFGVALVCAVIMALVSPPLSRPPAPETAADDPPG